MCTAPARDAIRYEQKVFDELGTRTIYHGPPNDETDQAWYDLYMVGLSRITKEEAAMLPNWTEPIVGDEDHYIITLDYIHQLHCLNMVRMALWPERYGEPVLGEPIMKDDPTPFDHVDHCINILRENIVCNADITPDPYQWDEDKRQIMPRFDSVRTCRNFEAIQEWQMQHRMTVPVETWKWTHVGN
ncbi:hypothetical protein SISSUDRAFT_995092 [Sistotremastrum suecicum HHB10207 ss-3]|uniref:Uncharacterized protein n=1 Tax=Sistotremastrum suecicum HHB10207 ss-3 TaxID=1314776 RepID=A0A165WRY9_9AGAM|nr:hypothetical protein SISSUDRAFT_995092 [Sistotremastrum suecicum HHB10207 ss-3]